MTVKIAGSGLQPQIHKARDKHKRNYYMQEQAIKLKAKDKEIAILSKQVKMRRSPNQRRAILKRGPGTLSASPAGLQILWNGKS